MCIFHSVKITSYCDDTPCIACRVRFQQISPNNKENVMNKNSDVFDVETVGCVIYSTSKTGFLIFSPGKKKKKYLCLTPI